LSGSAIWRSIVLDELESLMTVFESTEQGVVISVPADSSIDLTQKEESDLDNVSDNTDEVRKP